MKRILIAPLDWGLGHATRCIPIIRELQRHGCEVLIAGSGEALALLQKEFPALPFFSLPGYDPKYPLIGSMVTAMARQLPHFARTIKEEHRALNKIIRGQEIKAVISDNRYGCWSPDITSVFVTHQSNIMMPRRFGFLGGIVRKLSDRLITRFDQCWVPDYPEGNSLAGDLVRFDNPSIRRKTKYIGSLSRFDRSATVPIATYDVVAVISGPEPQRSLFERNVVHQLEGSGLKYKVVRGLSRSSEPESSHIVNFLESARLKQLLESSRVIIARSGYSTIMDLSALGGKAVFVPTPGQTEQEYLAARMQRQGIAFTMPQNRFDLRTALLESKNYAGFKPAKKNALLADAVQELLSAL